MARSAGAAPGGRADRTRRRGRRGAGARRRRRVRRGAARARWQADRARPLVPRERRARDRRRDPRRVSGPLLPAAGSAGEASAAAVPPGRSRLPRRARARGGLARAATRQRRQARRAGGPERALSARRPEDRELRHRGASGRSRVRAGTRSRARRRAARVRVHRHLDQSGAGHGGLAGVVRGGPSQEGGIPALPDPGRPAGRFRGRARGGDALSHPPPLRRQAAPRSHGDRRREGTAGRGTRCGPARRSGAAPDRESRQARGGDLSAGAGGAAAPVAPPPDVKSLLAKRDWTMWRYREWLPLSDGEQPVTLGEGGTPLLPVPRLAARHGLSQLWVKDESTNPTGSFKARGLAAAVTRAVRAGAKSFVVPTAGNAGVALAAYAARAGVPGRVYAPASTPATILSQSMSFGGDLGLVEGHIGDGR